MKPITTTIEGYLVELEFDEDTRSQCQVTHGRFGASLAALNDIGVLTDFRDREHHVPAWIIHKIYDWAENSGY